MSARKTDTKSARRARGLVRVELWIDPVIAATLEALRTKRNETSAQTVRAALLLLFQMQATRPDIVKIQTSSTYGKTAAEVIGDAVARGVSSGMASALGTHGRGAAKIRAKKCTRCGFVACACIGGVKR